MANENRPKRTVSQLRFPYYDLRISVDLVRKVFDERGGRVTQDGLAEMLGSSKEKSAFQLKVGAGELFGLLKRDADGLAVTDLALMIVRPRSPSDEARAMAEAFLSVPLFDAVQKQYAGRPLPPAEGLRNALEIEFGVVRKRVPDVFWTLTRSAEHAHLLYKSAGNTYLSRGAAVAEPLRVEEPSVQLADEEAAGVVVPGGGPHPALGGLLQVLPDGSKRWTDAERSRWLQAFEASVKLLYPTKEEEPAVGQ
jgi:hypothetical protein